MKNIELNIVEEHLNSNNSPFRFNAKELDATERLKNVQWTFLAKGRGCRVGGNYYYGARYGVYPCLCRIHYGKYSRRDPKWSIPALSRVEGWLSVDPLAEQMPEWSSYAYTFNNPVNFTDPTGMIGEGVETEYEAIWNEETQEYDKKEISSLGKDEYDITHYKGGENDGRTEISSGDYYHFVKVGADVIKDYEHRDSDIDYRDVFNEFVKGFGPKRSLFDDDHPMTEDIKNSYLGSKARKLYADEKNEKSFEAVGFGLKGIYRSGLNMTEQMVGSATVSVYPLGDKFLVLVRDSKSPRSLFLRLPNVKPRYNRDYNIQNKLMPYSVTIQNYIWIESVD